MDLTYILFYVEKNTWEGQTGLLDADALKSIFYWNQNESFHLAEIKKIQFI